MSKKKNKQKKQLLRYDGFAATSVPRKSNPFPLKIYEPPEGVIGDPDITTRANDNALARANDRLYGNFNLTNDPRVALWEEGIGFPGYSYLARLFERVEYVNIVTTRMQEMTREWIEFRYLDKDKVQGKDKISEIEEAFEKFNIQSLIRTHLINDGIFGISHLAIDLTTADNDPEELQSELILSNKKIKKGELKGFVVVEPIWVTPVEYNTTDPLNKHFYKPSMWWMMGRQVHASRLLTLVTEPVTDIIKPFFNFGGKSLAFMCKPYVDNWLRTRQSVSDITSNFSHMVIKTELDILTSRRSCNDLTNRIEVFNAYRNNQGVSVINQETEDIANIAVPLSGLDKLQAQALEQIASVSGIPLVKLLGTSPSGLNASSDGEIRAFYDKIAATQESHLRKPLEKILKIIQLHLFGEIDPNITFDFNPLWQLDDLQQSQVDGNIVEQITRLCEASIITSRDAQKLLNDAGISYMNDVQFEEPPNPFEGGGGIENEETVGDDKTDGEAE